MTHDYTHTVNQSGLGGVIVYVVEHLSGPQREDLAPTFKSNLDVKNRKEAEVKMF